MGAQSPAKEVALSIGYRRNDSNLPDNGLTSND